MMTRKLLSFFALALFLAAAGPLAAADIRFELGFGWTLVGPFMNATYVSQYQPTLTPPDRYVASAADQTVHFKAKTTYGMNGFFNVLFTENIGLQVLADYHRPGLGGSNAPYQIEMQFLAFDDVPETYARPIDWANSAGNLTETMFSLNALARFRVADNLSLSVSAGPSVFHFEGKAGHIGYTYFNLALVNNEYELTGGTYQDGRRVRPPDQVRHEYGDRGGLRGLPPRDPRARPPLVRRRGIGPAPARRRGPDHHRPHRPDRTDDRPRQPERQSVVHPGRIGHPFRLLRPAQILARRSRRELLTTDTELMAMAAEAIMGLSRTPKNG